MKLDKFSGGNRSQNLQAKIEPHTTIKMNCKGENTMTIKKLIQACLNDFHKIIIHEITVTDTYGYDPEEDIELIGEYTKLTDIPADILEKEVEYFYIGNDEIIIDF